MTWADYVSVAAVVGALLLSAYQTRQLGKDARQRDQDRRVERALELYRDLVVEGDTAASFNRLSVELRNQGTLSSGFQTWHLMDETEFAPGGMLDPGKKGRETYFQDLYRVLWYFERVENALDFSLVDPKVLMRTVGFHCWWWGQLLLDVRSPKASSSLHKLAIRAARSAEEEGEYDDWVARCVKDFGGEGPRTLFA